MKKNIKFLLLAVGLCLVLQLTASAISYKGLKYLETMYDFGQIGIEFKVFHDFKVYNDSEQPVRIDSLEVPCECSFVNLTDSVVNPNDTMSIRLTFETTHYYGPTRKSITIHASDGHSTTLQYLSDIGRWPQGLKPDPNFLFFIPGQKSKTIKIKNDAFDKYRIVRTEPLDTLYSIDISDRDIKKGEEALFTITPREDIQAGTYLSSFRITVELPDKKNTVFLTIPVKIVRY
ncbi:MAG: DUF1573 domain-containing protein [Candidatus Zixiibacteriota bacterium]